MIQTLEANRVALELLCCKYFVISLEVFGSAASGDFNPDRSDLDFLVEFRDHPQLNAFQQFFGFQQELERLFDRKVDLVDKHGMRNPYFMRSVEKSKQTIYAA